MISIPARFLTLKYKLAAVGILLLLAGFLIRRWGISMYDSGRQDGRESAIREEVQRIEAEIATERATLAQERAELDAAREALSSENASLRAQRRQFQADLTAGLGQIADRQNQTAASVATIPDSDLNGAIRLQLEKLR